MENASSATSHDDVHAGAIGCELMNKNEPPMPRDYLTIKEFCAAVRISERHFYKLRAADRGPRLTKLGGRYLVTRDELRRYIAANTEDQYLTIR